MRSSHFPKQENLPRKAWDWKSLLRLARRDNSERGSSRREVSQFCVNVAAGSSILQPVQLFAGLPDEEDPFIFASGIVIEIDRGRVAVAEVDRLADMLGDL